MGGAAENTCGRAEGAEAGRGGSGRGCRCIASLGRFCCLCLMMFGSLLNTALVQAAELANLQIRFHTAHERYEQLMREKQKRQL